MSLTSVALKINDWGGKYKETTIYTIYEWLWHEVDSGADSCPSAGGQGVDTSVDHIPTKYALDPLSLHNAMCLQVHVVAMSSVNLWICFICRSTESGRTKNDLCFLFGHRGQKVAYSMVTTILSSVLWPGPATCSASWLYLPNFSHHVAGHPMSYQGPATIDVWSAGFSSWRYVITFPVIIKLSAAMLSISADSSTCINCAELLPSCSTSIVVAAWSEVESHVLTLSWL